jgi:UDP-N-acetylmuramoyl-L-alanyl-D-glutamate--2,6-diaminopimelate ligase
MVFDKLLKLVRSKRGLLKVCFDSKEAQAGDVFVAIKGSVFDGHDYIKEAVTKGAKYVVYQQKHSKCNPADLGCGAIAVEDSAVAGGLLAQASAGNPASKLINLAVTGTNGKTTVAFMVRSIIHQSRAKCGLIGTVLYDTGLQRRQAHLTTPDSLAVAMMQAEMVKAGIGYMVIEASSHSLCQKRLAGIDFAAAAFTNLTGDHLDYHKTQEQYLAAKSLLFEGLSSQAVAVLNKQSTHCAVIAEKTKAKILWYAVDEPADITAHIKSMDINGSSLLLEYASKSAEIKTTLPGRYNVGNILAAAGLCIAAGFELETIVAGLTKLKAIPGRLEKVDGDADFSVLVDYAHTDDALKNVLSTLRPVCKGKLRLVFGAGGDRDRSKRPRMARIAERLADFVYVTSDNPRTENAMEIIDEIAAGFEEANSVRIAIEPDRKKAIELALKSAGKNDIVLIAGKGHETYQIIGEQRFQFSDKETVLQYLKESK